MSLKTGVGVVLRQPQRVQRYVTAVTGEGGYSLSNSSVVTIRILSATEEPRRLEEGTSVMGRIREGIPWRRFLSASAIRSMGTIFLPLLSVNLRLGSLRCLPTLRASNKTSET
jgi:hypothetical protein